MQCAEVIRELAVPSDERDAPGLAQHLLSCQTCAAWAEHATRLEELWESTKPREPGVETWDAVWTSISASLDSPQSLDEVTSPAISMAAASSTFHGRFDAAPVVDGHKAGVRGRSLVAIALIGLAQAAAILVAVGLGWRQPQVDPNSVPFHQASISTMSVEIEEGRTILIRSRSSECAVLDLTPHEPVHGVDDFYVMFNAIESMANNALVAME